MCSGGKLFGVTGWRIGWAFGPKTFIDKMYSVCKCDTFGTAAILQVMISGFNISFCCAKREMGNLFSKIVK